MKASWQSFRQAIEARDRRERAVLLGALLLALAYAWLVLGHDRLEARRADAERQVAQTDAQLVEQARRLEDARASHARDPDTFARLRLAELQAEEREVDARLDALYGRLISPMEMAGVLSTILRRETSLRLVALENGEPEALVAMTPQIPAAPSAPTGSGQLQVFKHRLRLQFEGSFLETLRYLRSLEALDSNFFWESLDFELIEHPQARISLEIFTLSTQRGYIGV